MDPQHDALSATASDHPEVEVGVLGPVEVRGAARPFRRAWSLDLVVYLAMHPRGVTSSEWSTALWPDRLMAAPTLHSTASAARRSLGKSSNGQDHLPRRHGSLRLQPSVTTDVQRLERLAASPDPVDWETGLSLIRGRPFSGLRSDDWIVLEGIEAAVGEIVVALAIRSAEHHLVGGDGRAAAQGARRGLLAAPYDERLYRILLRAADVEGNPAGVESVMSELLRLVAGFEIQSRERAATGSAELTALVHSETAALYHALSRRRPATRGTVARL